MRIIAGKFKSKRITAPKKLPVRPTTDMAKEALFNILNNRYYFAEITIIDLFAGTGNISYEFASRGTENIIAVDNDMGCVRFIETTTKDMDLDIVAYKSDVFSYLQKSNTKADIIFADPFYDMAEGQYEKMVALIFSRDLLLKDGVLIIEHASKLNFSELEHFVERRKYGSSAFSFFA